MASSPSANASPSAGLEALSRTLRGFDRLAVAVSGGVDSAFLLRVACDTLGPGRVTALTARSRLAPAGELEDAAALCRAVGVRRERVDFEPLAVEGFAGNPPDRCYLCKRALFGALLERCADLHLGPLAEGTNADDALDYRPGLRALRELGVRSPLLEAGLSKDAIRALSRDLDLPIWDKPGQACLATRFPHGDRITADGLARVKAAECLLRDTVPGLRQVRVRVHGPLARIEVPPETFPSVMAQSARIASGLRALGYSFVSLDLDGFRSGSLNPPASP